MRRFLLLRFIVVGIFIMMLLLAGALWAGMRVLHAQESGSCPPFVETVLRSLDDSCGGLARDTACYGSSRVDSVFWEPRDDLVFHAPADRVPLVDLQRISTSPLDVRQELWGVAVMHLQANLPDTLPGQAVLFLLTGDATVTNAVTPEQAAAVQSVRPVAAETLTAANLRSRPTTAANVVTSVRAGTELSLVGRNDAGDWYEASTTVGGNAWIYAGLIRPEDSALAAALPVTYGPNAVPRYGPMQAFYLSTGFAGPTCNEAPNALMVQSTELAEVELNVNELEIHIGSTIALVTVDLPGGGQALVAILLDGHLRTTVNGVPISLTTPGQAIAVTLNEAGAVDGGSRLVDVPSSPALETLLQGVQAGSPLLGALPGFTSSITIPDNVEDIADVLSAYVPTLPPPPGGVSGAGTGNATPLPTTGGWGGCGSCSDCGDHDSSECVLSPEGACLWDPTSCGYHGPSSAASLSGPSSVNCPYLTTASATVTYSSTDGAAIEEYFVVSSSPSEVSVTGSTVVGDSINISLFCGGPSGASPTITVTVLDTAGRTLTHGFLAPVS